MTMLIATDDCRALRIDDCDHDLCELSISGETPWVKSVKPDGQLVTVHVRCIVAARKLGRRLDRGEKVYNINGDRRDVTRENIFVKAPPA